MPSGPCALDEINAESFLNTEWVLTTSSGAGFVQFEQVMELTLKSGGIKRQEGAHRRKEGLIDGVCKVAG